MSTANKKIECVLETGDVTAVEALFNELGIGPDWPHKASESLHYMSADLMLMRARSKGKAKTFAYVYDYFSFSPDEISPYEFIETLERGNGEMISELIRIDPSKVYMDISHWTFLAVACQKVKDPEAIKAILEAGANPNEKPGLTPFSSHAQIAADAGHPALTIEYFFDAGYEYHPHDGLLRTAREAKRVDVMEVVFKRVKGHEAAGINLKHEMSWAKRTKNEELVAMLERNFPDQFPKRRGLKETFLDIFRPQSQAEQAAMPEKSPESRNEADDYPASHEGKLEEESESELVSR